MARGKRTDPNLLRAIVALYDAGFSGAEIADVFETPVGRRTIYDWLKTIKRERRRRERLEQEKQAKMEREQANVNTVNLRESWQRPTHVERGRQNIRRFRS